MKDTPSDAKETPQESLDKDVEEYQKWNKENEDNERKELQKDLEKFAQRPKPPYYSETLKSSMRGPEETSSEQDTSDSDPKANNQEFKSQFFPMEATTRYDLYEMERRGADSVELAIWRDDLPKSERNFVELNSKLDGKAMHVFDTDGKDFIFPHPSRNNNTQGSKPE